MFGWVFDGPVERNARSFKIDRPEGPVKIVIGQSYLRRRGEMFVTKKWYLFSLVVVMALC